jgi:hypothetical protein
MLASIPVCILNQIETDSGIPLDSNKIRKALARKKNWLWYTARDIAGVHRVADARNALGEFMEQAAKKHTAFALGGQDLAGQHLPVQQYTFNPAGIAIGRSFHVWQVQPVGNKLQFTDINFEM